jgi:hypothetical protein
MLIQNSGCNVLKTLHVKFDVKIKSKILKKYQTKMYKNAMEMYGKKLKIKTSKLM